MLSTVYTAPTRRDRYYPTLRQLLGATARLEPTLDHASAPTRDALDADAIDIFLYDPASESLIASISPRSSKA